MIFIRIKKFHKRTGRKLQFHTKDIVGFNKTKVECFNCHKIRHFARDCRAKGYQDNRRRDARQINDDDLEKMDLKWQVAMISIRIKKFHMRIGRKLQFDTRGTIGFDKTKVECFNCHKIRHFARDCRAKGNQYSRRRDGGYNGNKAKDNGRRPAYQDESKALVTIKGEAID
nr:ribonuclease H-like domain-containing protein [Tanacetum cinerariifolium]